jgi:hypothetical protein
MGVVHLRRNLLRPPCNLPRGIQSAGKFGEVPFGKRVLRLRFSPSDCDHGRAYATRPPVATYSKIRDPNLHWRCRVVCIERCSLATNPFASADSLILNTTIDPMNLVPGRFFGYGMPVWMKRPTLPRTGASREGGQTGRHTKRCGARVCRPRTSALIGLGVRPLRTFSLSLPVAWLPASVRLSSRLSLSPSAIASVNDIPQAANEYVNYIDVRPPLLCFGCLG